MSPLAIPDFLKLTAEQRAEAWATFVPPPPKPIAVVESAAPSFKEQAREKAMTRIARMKQNYAAKHIPAEFRHWNPRLNRFEDERVEAAERLRKAAERLGIKTENLEMSEKLSLVPYVEGRDQPADRGRTSIDADAAEHDRHQKLLAVLGRVGSKLRRVEVVKANGELLEVWTVQDGALHKDGGENLILTPPETPAAKKEEPVAQKKKVKSAKKANGHGGGKGVGVIATIVETMKRKTGASADEILAVLAKKFPDRKQKSMLSTVKIQAAKNAKKKDKDDKRGLVYYA